MTAITYLDSLDRHSMPPRENFEVAWCPRSADDFVPFVVGANTYETGLSVEGVNLSQRPAIHMIFRGGSASLQQALIVDTLWECFLNPANEFRQALQSPQNTSRVDKFINASKAIHYSSSGSMMEMVSSYAAKAARALSSPAAQLALGAGRQLLIGM
jgi:hypothetical protein